MDVGYTVFWEATFIFAVTNKYQTICPNNHITKSSMVLFSQPRNVFAAKLCAAGPNHINLGKDAKGGVYV